MLRSPSPARRGWYTRTIVPCRCGYAEVSSHKTSCRQPNALVWSLPRRSSAIACSRIQAMKRSTGMGVPCKPLPGQQLEQACPFPGLKRATWRVEKPRNGLTFVLQPDIVGPLINRDTAISSNMADISLPMQLICPTLGIDLGGQCWQLGQFAMSHAGWHVVAGASLMRALPVVMLLIRSRHFGRFLQRGRPMQQHTLVFVGAVIAFDIGLLLRLVRGTERSGRCPNRGETDARLKENLAHSGCLPNGDRDRR